MVENHSDQRNKLKAQRCKHSDFIEIFTVTALEMVHTKKVLIYNVYMFKAQRKKYEILIRFLCPARVRSTRTRAPHTERDRDKNCYNKQASYCVGSLQHV